jgi:hypothetical protein
MSPFEERVQTSNQGEHSASLASLVTGTGAQTAVSLAGYDGTIVVEVTAIGTVSAQAATFTIQGGYDDTNFYTADIEPFDAQTTLTDSVSGQTITPGNGTLRHTYKVRDKWDWLLINISANTLSGTGAGLTATVHAEPV